jgi:hypothetical protein
MIKNIFLAVILFHFIFGLTNAYADSVETYKDWKSAVTSGKPGAMTFATWHSKNISNAALALSCEGGYNGTIGVAVMWVGASGSKYSVSKTVELDIDGAYIRTTSDTASNGYGLSSIMHKEVTPDVNHIFQKMKSGNSVKIRVTNGGDDFVAKFSLNGMTKASYKLRKQCGL